MTKIKTTKILMIVAILPTILMLSGCNPLEKQSKSTSFIIVENILSSDVSGQETNFLQSDVVRVNAGGGTTVFADQAKATLRATMYDPAPILDPTQYNDIILDRYIVSYSRTDGKSRQGIDVPYTFEGSLTQLLKIGTSTSVSFVVVREVAKLELPLLDLVANRAEGVIEMTATIDFYGHDMINHTVKATGYLTIFFANYADPASTTAAAGL
jgi:hypothetical protein